MRLAILLVTLTGCAQILGISDPNGGSGSGDAGTHAGTDAFAPDADRGGPADGSKVTPDGAKGPPDAAAACAVAPVMPAPVQYAANGALQFAVGDVTGDGYADIVVATATDTLVFSNDGSGGLGAGLPLHPTLATPATGVRIVSLAGDGHNDVVTWNGENHTTGATGTNVVSAHVHAAGGTFQAARSFSVTGLFDVQAGHFDAGATADLLAISNAGAVPYFGSSTTLGTFTAGTAVTNSNNVASVVDSDGDGFDDVLYQTPNAGVSVFYNSPTSPGTFTTATVSAGFVSAFIVGRMKAIDTFPDVVVIGATSGSLFTEEAARDFSLGDAAGNALDFPGPISVINGQPVAVDINGDGLLDLVGQGHAVLQCQDGTYVPPGAQTGYPVGVVNARDEVITDLDHAGALDVIQLIDDGPSQALEVYLR